MERKWYEKLGYLNPLDYWMDKTREHLGHEPDPLVRLAIAMKLDDEGKIPGCDMEGRVIDPSLL
jgi:hypothetical protein